MRARDNPFATDRVLRVRYRPQGWTWEQLLERLAALNHRGAIVGPEGRGKTTLLEDLGGRLKERGLGVRHVRLSRERPRLDRAGWHALFHRISDRDVILFDGAEQSSRWAWWRLVRASRAAGGLVITSHRAGLLPTLVECETDVPLLRGIVETLHPESADDREAIRSLFTRHGGNVRDALRELYDARSGDGCRGVTTPFPSPLSLSSTPRK
jgi:hypothetical protein